MSRPQSVAGGRPVIVTVRLSEAEAQVVDAARGPFTRGTYLRSLVNAGPRQPARAVAPATSGQVTVTAADPAPIHTHTWKRFSNYLDVCDCGVDRPHQAGTR